MPFCLLTRRMNQMGSTLNPIALRKAKIVYKFGLSKCYRGKGKKRCEQFFSFIKNVPNLYGRQQ